MTREEGLSDGGRLRDTMREGFQGAKALRQGRTTRKIQRLERKRAKAEQRGSRRQAVEAARQRLSEARGAAGPTLGGALREGVEERARQRLKGMRKEREKLIDSLKQRTELAREQAELRRLRNEERRLKREARRESSLFRGGTALVRGVERISRGRGLGEDAGLADEIITGAGPNARVTTVRPAKRSLVPNRGRFVPNQGEEAPAIDDFLGADGLDTIFGADQVEEDLLGPTDEKGRRDQFQGLFWMPQKTTSIRQDNHDKLWLFDMSEETAKHVEAELEREIT